MDRITVGHFGEEIAVNFLTKKGYKVIERNFRKRSGEIDVITFDVTRNEWVFVEVKTRRSHAFGRPEEAVNARKIAKMTTAAQLWLHKNGKDTKPWRLDVIAITIEDEKTPIIEHFENIS